MVSDSHAVQNNCYVFTDPSNRDDIKHSHTKSHGCPFTFPFTHSSALFRRLSEPCAITRGETKKKETVQRVICARRSNNWNAVFSLTIAARERERETEYAHMRACVCVCM